MVPFQYMTRHKMSIDPSILRKLYWDEGLSTYDIAGRFDCSASTIESRLEDFHIPKKSSSLARMKYPKRDFSGLSTDRAYLVGFRVGDLNVYKTSPTAETIVVRCHTTQRDQIDVIQNAFSPFGKVTISHREGHYHVNCFLNSSFSFLLPKNENSFSWVKKLPEYYAFTAGYVDAEGNFIINQGKARFKIYSYDKDVLEFITGWLEGNGIHCRFRRISMRGDTQYIKGVPAKYPKDLWRLNINEARSLLNFITAIKPFIRHRKRLEDMLMCRENIITRINHGTVA
jgi:intein-encoded DNA endonuclease-like protein